MSYLNDKSVVEWISAGLTGDVGSVTSAVPGGFMAYARIFHPAATTKGTLTRWSKVAAETGRTMHARAQWHALVGSADPDNASAGEWDGYAPDRGNIAETVFQPLCMLLDAFTADAVQCYFGLWTNWVWVRRRTKGRPERIAAPQFGLPRYAGRDYFLMYGPLYVAAELGSEDELVGFVRRSPQLIWPENRSWFLSSDIDFDSTLVGGDSALIESIVTSPLIEAWRIQPADMLTAESDDLNSTI